MSYLSRKSSPLHLRFSITCSVVKKHLKFIHDTETILLHVPSLHIGQILITLNIRSF